MLDETKKPEVPNGKRKYLADWYASRADAEKGHQVFRPVADHYIRFVHEIIPLIREIEEVDDRIYTDAEQALLACGSFILEAIGRGGDPVKAINAITAFTFRLAAFHSYHRLSHLDTGEVTDDLPHNSDFDREIVRWFEMPEYHSETLFIQLNGDLRLHILPIARDVIITREDIIELAKRKMDDERSDGNQRSERQ